MFTSKRMSGLRIKGLVRLTNQVREELSRPVGERRLAELRKLVDDSLRHVQQICADHETTPEQLPAPSRKAYQYLASIDWSQVEVSEAAQTEAPAAPKGRVRFTGLQKSLDQFAEALSVPDPPEAATIRERIADLSNNIENQIEADGLQIEELTEPTRRARGWLAFMAQKENFDRYLEAVVTAAPLFESEIQSNQRLVSPARIQFRPIKPPAKVSGNAQGTTVQMQTPMVGFTKAEFEAVAAELISRRGAREQLHRAMTSESYQSVLAELEALGGVVEKPQGAVYDLAAAFDRVNRHYFADRQSRPRLTWSRSFTGRKFGHYDHVHDTIMLSATLDRQDVPQLTVDFIMYHELLHRDRGMTWLNGRARAHDSAFQQAERQFEQFHRAEQVLEKLAKGH